VKLCARPGCPQWTFSDEDHCSYCTKVREGLIVPDVLAFGRNWSRPRLERRAATISSADVISDEQVEVAALLRILGASAQTISRAIARDPQWSIAGARHGTGVKRGRVVA
jgi:hypothetical protein